MLYDTASGPPEPCDGGVLLSVNGLRALKALDANLYTRIATELASPVFEALWFDIEGELVRRAPLGQPSAGASGGRSSGRRVSASRRTHPYPPASGNRAPPEPDAAAPPLVISLHDLREALAEALPEDVQIFGRHHVTSIEPGPGGASADGAAASGSGGAVVRFAGSAGGSPVRAVRTRLLVGADGPWSAVKRLQFDGGHAQQQQRPQEAAPAASGRVVWRGRFTLRQRDPDFARLRNFTTAMRTWVDLRATHGSERTASLSPAGPNTYVWSASCPASLLPSRGLSEGSGGSAYWRCLAMFEDFPQDFFAALRATAASAVVEYGAAPAPATAVTSAAAAAGLAAPWRWFSGAAALVGDAVYSLPVDDVSSAAVNLALEDAAVLGACTAQYGMTERAFQEYARQRGPRVSALLALPPSAPERARLRDAVFLPAPPPAASPLAQPAAPAAAGSDAAAAVAPSLASTVEAAVDAAAAAAVVVTSPSQPLEDLLTKAAAVTAAVDPLTPVGPASPLVGRPSGGASRAPSPSAPAALLPLPSPAGPSSPLFSRPSGARRMGPVPAAIAAFIGILAAGASGGKASSAAPAAAATSPLTSGKDGDAGAAAPNAATPMPATAVASTHSTPEAGAVESLRYTVDSTPRGVWESLLRTHGSVSTATGTTPPHRAPREYCSVGTPAAVWKALLVAPNAAHDMLVTVPYNAAESPALVWMALLGAWSAAPSAATSASGAPASATATDSSPASQDSPCTLLPRPVLKQKSTAAEATAPVAAAAVAAVATSAAESVPAPRPEGSSSSAVESLAAPLPVPSPERHGPAATAGAGSAASGGEQQPRRRPRSQAGPVSGRWAGGDRRGSAGGGKAAGAYGKARRSGAAGSSRTAAAASATTAVGSTASSSPSAASKVRAKANAAAAKAAATVTASLSAAAALGGVIGAGTGHMPVDMAAALHAHGAVAQFWDDLNNLTLSSASLSSMDLS